MNIDFWYGSCKENIAAYDCIFYPNDGYFAGNVYDKKGMAIGDYFSNSSITISNYFGRIERK